MELVLTAHPTEAQRRSVLEKVFIIDRLLFEREYRMLVPGAMEPARVETFGHDGAVVLMTPGHVYKDDDGIEHYAESHRVVLLGRALAPRVSKQKDGLYVVTAAPTTPATGRLDSLVLHIRGNSELVSEILAKTNWNQLLELLN